jgi:2-polyprenyl-3-methyl-5-hydroxy-6-metoxy-1,4-benzoquinol methylase
MSLALPTGLPSHTTGATDPIRYYRRPGIGWVFRRRIEMGLEMIPPLPSGARALEVGYAAGVVLYNLAPRVAELYGIDLDTDPSTVVPRLAALGVSADLARGSVLDMRSLYKDNFFDLIVCFSVMEHIAESTRALDEMRRVLKPGGVLIVGMPAVNQFMEMAFCSIGFKGIEDHHITTPTRVWGLIKSDPEHWLASRRSLPGGVPFSAALYHTFQAIKR